jgi:hypothetical protein
MITDTKIKVEDIDMNQILDLMGHAHRAPDLDAYTKLTPYIKQAVQDLAQRAFFMGREFERKNSS